MDSATNKKLFPDFSDAPVVFESVPSSSKADFQVAGGVWESLLKEPAFEAQLREWIDKIASERLQSRMAEIEKQARDAAHLVGMKEGLEHGTQAMQSALQTLQSMTQELVVEKQKLLHSHEETFCDTFFNVLEQLAVPDAKDWSRHIEAVLSKYSIEFGERARVEVCVSPQAWAQLQAAGAVSAEGLRWSTRVDENLAPGKIRFDFGGVGMDLSALEQVQEWKAAAKARFQKAG